MSGYRGCRNVLNWEDGNYIFEVLNVCFVPLLDIENSFIGQFENVNYMAYNWVQFKLTCNLSLLVNGKARSFLFSLGEIILRMSRTGALSIETLKNYLWNWGMKQKPFKS